MDKSTIARALGLLTDVRQTMVNINRGENDKPWVNTLDHALGLIKNELTVEEAHTFKQRNA